MPDKQFRFRPRALQDLEEIDLYTYREFGTRQTDKYIKSLFTAFQDLANQPTLGKKADYIRPKLIAYRIGSHIVFYKTSPKGIIIIRVLHKAMDLSRHL